MDRLDGSQWVEVRWTFWPWGKLKSVREVETQ